MLASARARRPIVDGATPNIAAWLRAAFAPATSFARTAHTYAASRNARPRASSVPRWSAKDSSCAANAAGVAAVGEHVELQRARGQAPGVAGDRARQRLERTRGVPLGGRVLRDAHRERRGQARVLLGGEAPLGQSRARRRVARLLGDADARVRDRGLGDRRFFGRQRRDQLERAVERRRGPVELPEDRAAPRRRAATRRPAARAGAPSAGRRARRPAPSSAMRLVEQRRRRLERRRVGLGAGAPLVGSRDARVIVGELLEQRRRRPRHVRARARAPRGRARGRCRPPRRPPPCARDRAGAAPSTWPTWPSPRAARAPLRASRYRPSVRPAPRASSHALACSAVARTVDLRRVAREPLRVGQVVRHVRLVGGAHQQRARPSRRATTRRG